MISLDSSFMGGVDKDVKTDKKNPASHSDFDGQLYVPMSFNKNCF